MTFVTARASVQESISVFPYVPDPRARQELRPLWLAGPARDQCAAGIATSVTRRARVRRDTVTKSQNRNS